MIARVGDWTPSYAVTVTI